MKRKPTGNATTKRLRGFTLLEVILAIAILAVSLAAIGEVVRSAFGNASDAADGLEARLVAQSIMDELKCGARDIIDAGPEQVAGVQGAQQPALANWSFQILTQPTIADDLIQVRVLVGRSLAPNDPASCELVRWFPDPNSAPVASAGTQ